MCQELPISAQPSEHAVYPRHPLQVHSCLHSHQYEVISTTLDSIGNQLQQLDGYILKYALYLILAVTDEINVVSPCRVIECAKTGGGPGQ